MGSLVIPSCIVHERRALKSEELYDIISLFDDLEPRDRLLAALLICTGMRRGEVLGLRHCDIDINGGFIHVVQTTASPHVACWAQQRGIHAEPVCAVHAQELQLTKPAGKINAAIAALRHFAARRKWLCT